jgi:hypothetical protein
VIDRVKKSIVDNEIIAEAREKGGETKGRAAGLPS